MMFASLAEICATGAYNKKSSDGDYITKNMPKQKNSAKAKINSIPAHAESDVQKTTTTFFGQFCITNTA